MREQDRKDIKVARANMITRRRSPRQPPRRARQLTESADLAVLERYADPRALLVAGPAELIRLITLLGIPGRRGAVMGRLTGSATP